MVTALMVSGLGVCALIVECVSEVLLMSRLVTRLPTDGITAEGLGRGREQGEVGDVASSRGQERGERRTVAFFGTLFLWEGVAIGDASSFFLYRSYMGGRWPYLEWQHSLLVQGFAP